MELRLNVTETRLLLTAQDEPDVVLAAPTTARLILSSQGVQGPAGGGGGGSLAWGDITGKPASFPPDAHGHAVADVTGLQGALDGKATAAQGAKADTALQPAAIGATVQGYSAILAATTASYTAAEAAKLAAIAAGATANDTNANLRDRATHTGAQAIATITGLQAAIDGKAAAAHGHVAADVSDFTEAAQDATGAMVGVSLVYNDAAGTLGRAALSGAVTAATGSNATALGSFTLAQLNTAISDADVATGGGTATGTNTGDQTSIAGITGTKAQFDTAVTDGNFAYAGDAPTAHTHIAVEVTDFASAADARVAAGITGKQNALVSGTNIKTVNGVSLLGAGNVEIAGGGSSVTQVTLTAPAGTRGQCAIIVADAAVTALSKVTASLVAETAAINDLYDLADNNMRVWAIPQAGSVRFVLTGKGPFVGPFKANYEVAA